MHVVGLQKPAYVKRRIKDIRDKKEAHMGNAKQTVIDWHQPTYLDLPDLRMAVFQAGEKSSHRPSIVLCHGFPEMAYSWRHIVGPLVDAGFHVVMPEQRGYGFTGAALSDAGDASAIPLYDMTHLCGDLAHLLDALEIDKAIFAGNDWGGLVTWQLPFFHPDRVAGLVGVNTPFIPRLSMDPIEAFRAVYGDAFYICAFQEYGVAEACLDADKGRTLRSMYRSNNGISAKPAATTHNPMWDNLELLNILKADENDWPGRVLFSDEVLAYYTQGFERSGFRGPVNWYRNFSRNWEMSADFEQKITLPSLMICAENDKAIPPSMADGMEKYVPDLEKHLIKDCGHWTQNEKPEALSGLMVDWLSRRF